MKKKLDCILLIDDDPEDNFFHKIIIERSNVTNKVDVVLNGIEALDYLKKDNQVVPELIFLDINMPKMNGWEFLTHYKQFSPNQKAKIVIMMLTTSANPDDVKRAKEIEEVTGFETKPLTPEMLEEIMKNYFPTYLE